MAFKVEIHRSAQKQMLSLPKDVQVETALAIDRLKDTPRQAGCKKLRETGLWRIRVGRYRVVYAIDDKAKLITVLKVAARRENTYKNL